MATKPFRFLNLPAEIHCEIYKYAFGSVRRLVKSPIEKTKKDTGVASAKSITETCRLCHMEANTMFYSSITFVFAGWSGLSPFQHRIGTENIRLIKFAVMRPDKLDVPHQGWSQSLPLAVLERFTGLQELIMCHSDDCLDPLTPFFKRSYTRPFPVGAFLGAAARRRRRGRARENFHRLSLSPAMKSPTRGFSITYFMVASGDGRKRGTAVGAPARRSVALKTNFLQVLCDVDTEELAFRYQ
jgi:hypothetical protein